MPPIRTHRKVSIVGLLLTCLLAGQACQPDPTPGGAPSLTRTSPTSATAPTETAFAPRTTVTAEEASVPTASAAADITAQPLSGRIAFYGNNGVYLIDSDGTDELRILDADKLGITYLSWSPDGQYLLLSTRDSLYRVNADGSDLTLLAHNPDGMGGGVYSPNGQWIAFLQVRANNGQGLWEVAVMLADGVGRQLLAQSDGPLSWSPDSQWVGMPGRMIRLSDVSVQGLPGLPGVNGTPIWSPDGSRIALAIPRDGNGDDEIYVMHADGTQLTNLTNNPARDYAPAWSLDGQQIAFMSDREGALLIFVMDADGANVRRLVNWGSVYRPAWQPPGGPNVTPTEDEALAQQQATENAAERGGAEPGLAQTILLAISQIQSMRIAGKTYNGNGQLTTTSRAVYQTPGIVAWTHTTESTGDTWYIYEDTQRFCTRLTVEANYSCSPRPAAPVTFSPAYFEEPLMGRLAAVADPYASVADSYVTQGEMDGQDCDIAYLRVERVDDTGYTTISEQQVCFDPTTHRPRIMTYEVRAGPSADGGLRTNFRVVDTFSDFNQPVEADLPVIP
jgi:dipeptidyl aminopeptidase/acylaminoacyl peptidase